MKQTSAHLSTLCAYYIDRRGALSFFSSTNRGKRSTPHGCNVINNTCVHLYPRGHFVALVWGYEKHHMTICTLQHCAWNRSGTQRIHMFLFFHPRLLYLAPLCFTLARHCAAVFLDYRSRAILISIRENQIRCFTCPVNDVCACNYCNDIVARALMMITNKSARRWEWEYARKDASYCVRNGGVCSTRRVGPGRR